MYVPIVYHVARKGFDHIMSLANSTTSCLSLISIHVALHGIFRKVLHATYPTALVYHNNEVCTWQTLNKVMFQPERSDPDPPARPEGGMRRERRSLVDLEPMEIPSAVHGDGAAGDIDQYRHTREVRSSRLDSRISWHSRLDLTPEECSGDVAMEENQSSAARSVDDNATAEGVANNTPSELAVNESHEAAIEGADNNSTIERADTPSGQASVRFSV